MQTRKKQRLKESRVPCKDHEAVLDEIDEDAAHQRQLSLNWKWTLPMLRHLDPTVNRVDTLVSWLKHCYESKLMTETDKVMQESDSVSDNIEQ